MTCCAGSLPAGFGAGPQRRTPPAPPAVGPLDCPATRRPCPMLAAGFPACGGEDAPHLCSAVATRALADRTRFKCSVEYGWPAPRSLPIRRPRPAGRWPDHADRAPFPKGDGRVTVIIPNGNRPHLIGRATESVRAQGFDRWTLLVVLNGPAATDPRYHEVLAPYLDDPRIAILPRPALSGIAAPINAGLAPATTEYAAVLDDDDEWAPEFLDRLVGALDSDRTLGLAYCGATHPSDDGRKHAHAPHPEMDGTSFGAAMARRNWFGWSQAVFRLALLMPAGLSPEAGGCADRDAWLRIAAVAGVRCLPGEWARHHWHGGNASSDLAWIDAGSRWVDGQVRAGRYRAPAVPR